MVALNDVRNGIEDRLKTIDGLRIVDGSQINPPAAVVAVAGEGVSYHQTFQDGLTDFEMRVIVYVSSAYTRTARDELDAYLDVTGTKSVKQAIEGDPTLGGVVHDLVVHTGRQDDFVFRESTAGSTGGTILQFLGADFIMTVQG